jgi:hypothetical protein
LRVFCFVLFFLFWCWDGIHGLKHARQLFYHWATS